MQVEVRRLKGIITHATHTPRDRHGMICQCCVCGITAPCRAEEDFQADPGDKLVCLNCCRQGKRDEGAELVDITVLIAAIVENTRAACAQMAALVMYRETGKAIKNGERLPCKLVAEEIRDRILMAPDSVGKDWQHLRAVDEPAKLFE